MFKVTGLDEIIKSLNDLSNNPYKMVLDTFITKCNKKECPIHGPFHITEKDIDVVKKGKTGTETEYTFIINNICCKKGNKVLEKY